MSHLKHQTGWDGPVSHGRIQRKYSRWLLNGACSFVFCCVCLVLRVQCSLDTCWGPTGDTVETLTLGSNLAVCAKDTMAPRALHGQPIPIGHSMVFTPAESVIRKDWALTDGILTSPHLCRHGLVQGCTVGSFPESPPHGSQDLHAPPTQPP